MAEYDVVEVIPKEDGTGFEEFTLLGTSTLITELDEDQGLEVGNIIQAEATGKNGTSYDYRSAGGAGGAVGVQFAKITQAVDKTTYSEYKCKKIDSSGVVDTTELTIPYPLGYEAHGAYGEQWRNWAYFWKVNDIVPIAEHYDAESPAGLKWFINIHVSFIGAPADRSLAVNENEGNRLMCVFK